MISLNIFDTRQGFLFLSFKTHTKKIVVEIKTFEM